MKPSVRAISLIKEFEGFSPKIYLDAAGLPTIGYGHLLKKGEVFPPEGIDETEAVNLLKLDASKSAASVMRLINRSLSQRQFDALVCFVFNVGGGALQRSTLRQKINAGYDDEVPDEFMRWVWAGGKKMPGLIRRRQAEAELYGAAC